jgi:hypothetical protein
MKKTYTPDGNRDTGNYETNNLQKKGKNRLKHLVMFLPRIKIGNSYLSSIRQRLLLNFQQSFAVSALQYDGAL